MSDRSRQTLSAFEVEHRKGFIEGMAVAMEIVKHTGADGFEPDQMILDYLLRKFPDLESIATGLG